MICTTEKCSNERLAQIAAAIRNVRGRIAAAAARSGRTESDITLMAVTKTMPACDVNAAFACGIDVFGENRVQELLEKFPMLDARGKHAHLIGHLQTNKVKSVIDKVEMIESVDSLHLAREIDKRSREAGKVMDILVEVNIGAEESKSGIRPQDAAAFIDSISDFSGIRICGLMAIPPKCKNNQLVRPYFMQMRKLFIDIAGKKSDNMNVHILSMGMSSDFETAVEEGSTLVRVGTAIFGNRK